MFDTGGTAGQLIRATELIGEATASISSDMAGSEAGEALREAIAAEQQLTLTICLLTERVARTGEYLEDGAVSMSAWLRTAARCTPAWASSRIKTGKLLVDSLPCTRAAWAAGDLNFEHALVIGRACKGLDFDDTAAMDRALAAAAPNSSPTDLVDIANAILEHLAPETAEKDRDQKTAEQALHLSDVPDGGWMTGTFDPESTALLRAALAKATPEGKITVDPDGLVTPALSLSHRQALGMVEMARQFLDFGTGHAGGANKPHLVVLAALDDLRDQIGVGYLPGTGTLPIGDVRRIACDCKIIPVLLGSLGQPLDLGRTTRTVTPAQRVALNVRDKGCRHPDCNRPPADCEAHHVWHWLDGGPSDLDNLLLFCRGHHTGHHKGEFTVAANGDQQFTITKTPRRFRTWKLPVKVFKPASATPWYRASKRSPEPGRPAPG